MKPLGLVIAGGQSSRMGQDKSELVLHGKPLRERIAHAMNDFVEEVFISYRLAPVVSATPYLLDQYQDIGPAAGLLSAHAYAPDRDWLVIACDFPCASRDSIRYLLAAEPADVVCFEHTDSTPEPLFAVWSSFALRRLQANVDRGVTGPIQTLKSVRSRSVVPSDEAWIFNANTPEDWARVLSICLE